MIFPEELDNRSLRLLVDRTLAQRKDQKPLSKIEQDISDIVNEFPELGFRDNGELDLYAHYTEAEINPFLQLSAIWEIRKQLKNDSPRGFRKIVHDYFRTTSLKPDDLYVVADIYLALYRNQQDNETIMTEKEYLWEIYYALNQTETPRPKSAKKGEPENVPPGLVGDAFAAIARELHDEASFIKLNPHAPAVDNFVELPIEWINAMSNFWQRPEHKLKRDNVLEIVSYFLSPAFRNDVPQHLSREDKECLAYVIERNNQVSYSEASKMFGPEHNDGYWWTQDIPKSTLGNLRMMGLLIVGEMHMENNVQRMVMIPKEILPVVQSVI